MSRLIEAERSVIVAADVGEEHYLGLIRAVSGVPGISGVKIGFLGLEGLGSLVKVARRIAGENFVVIYDHQKAATDIPDTGKFFSRIVKKAGVDAAILFPQSGPATQHSWTEALQEQEIRAIVGGHMTHPQYLEWEGGYIHDGAPREIYRSAAVQGVRDFVVPGNKPEAVRYYRQLLEDEKIGDFDLYAPGFISQGGDITETAKVAGTRWHAIVGSAIYKAGNVDEMRAAAEKVTAQITS